MKGSSRDFPAAMSKETSRASKSPDSLFASLKNRSDPGLLLAASAMLCPEVRVDWTAEVFAAAPAPEFAPPLLKPVVTFATAFNWTAVAWLAAAWAPAFRFAAWFSERVSLTLGSLSNV